MDESNLTVTSASSLSPKQDQLTNSEELLKQAVANMKEIKIELDTDVPGDLTSDAVMAEYLGDPNEPENGIQIRLDQESLEEEVSDGEMRFSDFVSKQVKDNLKDSCGESPSQHVGGNSSLDDKTNVSVVASRFKPRNYKLVSKTDDVKGDITVSQHSDKAEQLKATPTSVSSFTRDLLDLRQKRQKYRQVQRALKKEIQQLTEKSVGEFQEMPVTASTGTSKKRTVTRQTVSSARGLEHFEGWQVSPNWPLSHGWSDTGIYGDPSLPKPTEMDNLTDSEIQPEDVLRTSGKSILCVSKERTSKVTELLLKLKMSNTDDK